MQKNKLLIFICSLIGVLGTACTTASSVTNAGDYDVCRIAIRKPPFTTSSAIDEANRQIYVRNLDCSRWASIFAQQQAAQAAASMMMLNQGLNMMQGK